MRLWTRTKEWVGRWFARPQPGRWLEGHGSSWHGLVAFRPWVFPRRRYRLYIPTGWSGGQSSPLIALLHGCRQTPDDFAQGARIAAAADRAGALVLMPDQKDGANPWRCWNWFDGRTARGKGEAAIVAAMIARVARRFGVDRERVTVAGMSSGAALAAVIGLRHPQRVARVFAHSGLACGAAASAFTAITVMRRGPETDVVQIAREARAEAGAARVALVVLHGADDDVVARLNAEALVRQYLAFDGIAVPAGANSTLPPPDHAAHDAPHPLRTVHTRDWRRDGLAVARLVEIGGLGHAWSGGDDAQPFNDPAPPDATQMLVDFASCCAE